MSALLENIFDLHNMRTTTDKISDKTIILLRIFYLNLPRDIL